MQSPAHVSFHGLDHSDAVEAQIRELIARLEKMFERITTARVVVEAKHQSHAHANASHRPFRVTVHLPVPGDELMANHGKDATSHADIDAAIRDAFRVIERQLRSYVERKASNGLKRA
ncbi:MAG: ribosome-associated translation inhibitor RaiA [Alphaproteobacteria bacterium]|nr:ribosome-associated translation inhibitor RaiA [Alphaproteobacteria bacterium]